MNKEQRIVDVEFYDIPGFRPELPENRSRIEEMEMGSVIFYFPVLILPNSSPVRMCL